MTDFYFFLATVQVVIALKIGRMCYYLQYIVISLFTLQRCLKTFIPNKHSHTERVCINRDVSHLVSECES